MASSVVSRLDSLQRKPLTAKLRSEAKPDRKPLAEDWKRRVGKAVERAIVMADLTKQEVSYLLGYPDQSAVSRWCSGSERPHFDKLMSIDALRPWIPVSMGEIGGNEVETTVKARRVG